MGIKGLLPFLKTKMVLPPLERTWPVNTVAAIDVPIFAHKFIYSERTYEGLEQRFLKFGIELKSQNFDPIFVFDGGKLDLKGPERIRRSVARDRQAVLGARKKSAEIESMLKLGICIKRSFSQIATVEPIEPLESTEPLEPLEPMEPLETLQPVESLTDLLPQNPVPRFEDIEIPEFFEGILKPTSKDYDTLFDTLERHGYKCRKAAFEAEALCAHLVCTNEAWCAITEDTDAIAFGSTRTIYKLFQEPIMVDLKNVLESIKLTQEQFIDLCCMLGCDFCNNVFKVGPETAYKLLLEHGSWSQIFDKMNSKWPLKTRESAQVFNDNYEKARQCFVSRAHELPTTPDPVCEYYI
jgi:5'-3' exonuclease